MAVGYASFTALYNYSPTATDEIELRVGDVILVKRPFDSEGLQTWLEGVNQRTKQCGQIPGPYLKEVADFPDTLVTNDHEFQKLIRSNPVCCAKCQDYIWGKNKNLYQCLACLKPFHLFCAKESDLCKGVEKNKDESPYDTLAKSPDEWSVTDVVSWMAAAKLFEYAHTFIKHNMSGAKLLNIDELYLTNMGICDEFHRKMILVCIGELVGNSETRKSRKYPGMITGQRGSINTHSFVLQTFTTVTWCHECGKILFGLVRQGLQCTRCELICHRRCTNYKILRVCPGKLQRESTEPVYIPLLEHNSIPAIVKKCVRAVESRGLRTRGIYRRQPEDSTSKYALRTALYQDAEDVNMKDEEWINPLCPSAVLLSYFNELPDPLLPSNLYKELIEIAGASKERALSDLDRVFEKLPEVNSEVLKYILDHLNRVSAAENNISAKDMGIVFGPILLRPSEDSHTEMALNIDAHSKIVELLLEREKRHEAINTVKFDDPSIISPPVPPRPRTGTCASQTINEAEWYWGELERRDALEKMNGWRDGSFLVRDSKGCPGEYTLSVRKGGESKLIRIYHHKGKYGFTEPYQFNSVPELIDYHRKCSLKEYNAHLDVRLLYPICREDDDVSGVKKATRILKIAGELFNEKSLRYEQLSDEIVECEQEMAALEEAVYAQKELINFLEEQVKINKTFQRESPPNDREKLEINYNLVADRLGEENRSLSCLEYELKEKSEIRRHLESDMNSIRPDLWELQHTKEKYMKFLEENNMNREEVELLAGQIDFKIYEFPMTEEEESVNLSKEYWLFGTLDRSTIQSYLKETPDGTFLIRDSNQNRGMKAVSIMFNGSIKHCVIDEGPEGYGFAEGFKTHKTLQSLVQYYHRVSLQMHNSGLATTLRLPVRCIKRNIPADRSLLD